VIIVLAVGFPAVVVLSWLCDLTGESLERTRRITGEVKVELTPEEQRMLSRSSSIDIEAMDA